MRERQEGRYYGLGITIQVDRRRHHRESASSKDRPPTRRASAAATSSPKIDGEDAKGWTTEQAMRKLRGPKGTHGRHRDQAPRLRRADSDSTSTRDEVNIPTVPGVLHDRRDDRLHPAAGLRREHRPRSAATRCSELTSKGMKRLLFDIRGNPGGPLDQAIKVAERVPAARRDDRLHARPRAELRSGLSRDRGRASSPTCRWSCWSTATARARRRSSPARCRITTARYIVGETTFGKALVQSVYRISGGAGLALTTGALLHAERPADSASVGRDLRRVSELHAARSGRRTARTTPTRPEAHRRRPPGLQRRRHRAGQAHRRAGRRASTRRASAACCTRRQEFANFAQQFTAEGDTRHRAAVDRPPKPVARGLRRRRRDGGRLPRAAEDATRSRSTRTRSRRTSTFIKAMIRFEIDDGAVRHRPRRAGT